MGRQKLPVQCTVVLAIVYRDLSADENVVNPLAVPARVRVGGALPDGFGVEDDDIRLISTTALRS